MEEDILDAEDLINDLHKEGFIETKDYSILMELVDIAKNASLAFKQIDECDNKDCKLCRDCIYRVSCGRPLEVKRLRRIK